jgi:phenylpropionate dioxygenase-like ring-hydroxylating dioxygenase large terminal subunit
MSVKLIKPRFYYDEVHFDVELERVFNENWLFGCLTSEIPKKNDYYLFELGKYSVIIYNNGKEIVALQNMCSHRFNRIFTHTKGNSLIICPFHSWGFDGCGVIRNKQIANTDDLIEQLSLKRYQVEIIGQFIFFHFSQSPIQSLLEQLHGLDEELILVSEILNTKIHEEDNYHKVNWKFICENVMDKTHCTSLHNDSLVKIGYCIQPEDEVMQFGNNSSFVLPPIQDKEREKRDKFLNKHLPRKIQSNNYKHSFYFPNLTIGIFEGLNITIGNILPISAMETNYKLVYFNTKIDKTSDFTNNLLDAMSQEVISFGTKVFEEDKVVLEHVQKGVMEAEHSGYVYENELRIKWFYQAYHKYIKDGKF